MAICIPVVRLRCSEQRITGVVNKAAFLCSPLAGRTLLYFSRRREGGKKKKSCLLTTLPLSHMRRGWRRREVVSVVSCHFCSLSRKRIPSPNAENGKDWHRRRNICLHSNAVSVESQGRYTLRWERSSKTRSGSCVLAGNGASLARPAVIAPPLLFFSFLGKHLHILNKHN